MWNVLLRACFLFAKKLAWFPHEMKHLINNNDKDNIIMFIFFWSSYFQFVTILISVYFNSPLFHWTTLHHLHPSTGLTTCFLLHSFTTCKHCALFLAQIDWLTLLTNSTHLYSGDVIFRRSCRILAKLSLLNFQNHPEGRERTWYFLITGIWSASPHSCDSILQVSVDRLPTNLKAWWFEKTE
jgi:hypothetical protein